MWEGRAVEREALSSRRSKNLWSEPTTTGMLPNVIRRNVNATKNGNAKCRTTADMMRRYRPPAEHTLPTFRRARQASVTEISGMITMSVLPIAEDDMRI